MYDLSSTMIMSFEITNDCNLKHVHLKCPISVRKKTDKSNSINVEVIMDCMRQAKQLNFDGYFAFIFIMNLY